MAADVTFDANLRVAKFAQGAEQAKAMLKGVDAAGDFKHVQGQLGAIEKRMGTIAGGIKGLLAIDVGRVAIAGARMTGRVLGDLYAVAQRNVQVWDDLEQSLGRQGVKLGEVREDVEAYASALSKATKVDDDDLVALVAQLVDGGYKLEDAYRNLPGVIDFASRKHIELSEAAGVMLSIFQGRGERVLRSYRVQVAKTGDAAKDAEAQMKAFMEVGAGSRQQELARNPMMALTLQLGNLKDKLAESVLPAISAQIQGVSDAVDRLDDAKVAAWGDRIGKIVSGAGKAAGAVDKVLTGVEQFSREQGVKYEGRLRKGEKDKEIMDLSIESGKYELKALLTGKLRTPEVKKRIAEYNRRYLALKAERATLDEQYSDKNVQAIVSGMAADEEKRARAGGDKKAAAVGGPNTGVVSPVLAQNAAAEAAAERARLDAAYAKFAGRQATIRLEIPDASAARLGAN